jgi:cellulose synthase/poly-beta-1,6-N-acetylglucosamine synthase-like glycosyltransferase
MKQTFLAVTPETRIILGSFVLYALLLWGAPLMAMALSVTVLGLTVMLVVARLACVLAARPAKLPTEAVGDELVSIHIATYSEPPEVVMATLDSLRDLSHPHYEVIVLDNNTPDPALYEPVREHCRKLGKNFRFYHFDNVKNAKAGALNISLKLTDPRAEAILILDADYQAVDKDILQKGLTHFVDSSVALVQFPQAYRNSRDDCGLTWDYRLFFDVYMNLANQCDTVLSTGTAAFVRKHALIGLGGWTGDTLTEDAELGLRLHRIGYRGVYVPQVVAAGVMPTDMRSLRVQRRRWVLGNAQSLRCLWNEPNIGLFRKAVMSLQLTAWASPLFLSTVTFLTAAVVARLSDNLAAEMVVAISTLSIMWYLTGTLLFYAVAIARHGGSLFTSVRALLVHLGMQWEGSLAWCELFVNSDKSFQRTDKFIRAPEMVAMAATLALSLLCCGIGFDILRAGGCPWTAFACSLSSLLLTAKSYLRWNLHLVRDYTVGMESKQPDLIPLGERLLPARLELACGMGARP